MRFVETYRTFEIFESTSKHDPLYFEVLDVFGSGHHCESLGEARQLIDEWEAPEEWKSSIASTTTSLDYTIRK